MLILFFTSFDVIVYGFMDSILNVICLIFGLLLICKDVVECTSYSFIMNDDSKAEDLITFYY